MVDNEGHIEQAETALAVVRAIAGDDDPASLFPRLLREVLFEADRDLGDGTARLALLWGGLVRHGLRALTAGVPAPALADALSALGNRLARALDGERSGNQPDQQHLADVASSAGASPALAREIGRLVYELGPVGAVELVARREQGPRTEVGAGFLLDAIPVSSAFAAVDLDPVHVLVADELINDFGPLVPLLEAFATRGKALVVVARDVTGTALHALVRNHRENGLRTAALRPAAVSQNAAFVLEDLAIATGATLVADRFGTSLKALRPAMLGRAACFGIVHGRAVFREPAGDVEAIATRRSLLLAEAERNRYLTLDRERFEQRAARLDGRWGRIHVPEGSDRETKTMLQAGKRALASARSAADGGTVPGAGLALVNGFDRISMLAPEGSDAAHKAAHHCLGSAISEMVWRLSPMSAQGRCRPEMHTRSPGRIRNDLGLTHDGIGPSCLDPFLLTRSILERAVSGATEVLRLGAILRQ